MNVLIAILLSPFLLMQLPLLLFVQAFGFFARRNGSYLW